MEIVLGREYMWYEAEFAPLTEQLREGMTLRVTWDDDLLPIPASGPLAIRGGRYVVDGMVIAVIAKDVTAFNEAVRSIRVMDFGAVEDSLVVRDETGALWGQATPGEWYELGGTGLHYSYTTLSKGPLTPVINEGGTYVG